MGSPTVTSELIQYLPAIFQQEQFVGKFLLAFEQVLLRQSIQDIVSESTREEDKPVDLRRKRGIEENISGLVDLFDPLKTPEDFLPWLSTWTAFVLRADFDSSQQRNFIAAAVSLYRNRGTKQNLEGLLHIFTGRPVTIIEPPDVPLKIGVHARIGVDTYLEGPPPHFFQAIIDLLVDDRRGDREETPQQSATRIRQEQIANAIIELEKPAHTTYQLLRVVPAMQLGVKERAEIGRNTWLGRTVEVRGANNEIS